ncbi:MAG: RNA 2',3'-cyclic phosphodiesterase [Anaerolineae bacterium]|nr:RNA 2',3'-cyclic phosphodiesterase [Anaerolineae bacterium]
MQTLRTFIAVELDHELKATLAGIQSRLRGVVPPRAVRWVQPEGIHLTLKFLGDTPLDKVEQVKAALARAAGQIPAFAITVGGVGCFPDARRPRVVWVGVQEPSGSLARLWQAVESHIAPLGFPTEKRPFSPHLTVGRVQRYASGAEARDVGQAVTALAAEITGAQDEMAVSAVAYIKSDLRPTGAIYTTLTQARLQEQAGG